MIEIITFLSLIGLLIVLGALSVIDLRIRLLPNELVLSFLALSFMFHLSTIYHYLDIEDMALGSFIGGGMLYFIRTLANMFYDEDALGLGDVKLLAAGGVLLGPYYILVAMTLGALAGIAHGIGLVFYYKIKASSPVNLRTLSLPAGPGFALGIILTALYAFRDLPELLLP